MLLLRPLWTELVIARRFFLLSLALFSSTTILTTTWSESDQWMTLWKRRRRSTTMKRKTTHLYSAANGCFKLQLISFFSLKDVSVWQIVSHGTHFFQSNKNSRFSTSELAVIRKINLPNFPDFRLLNLWLESNDKQKRNKSISHNWQLHYFGTRKIRANKNWSYGIFESENLL